MRRSSAFASAAFVISAAGAALAVTPASFGDELPVDPSWAADRIWDDGLAEVSLYDAERVVYGVPRAHPMVMVVVKEDLAADTRVKADPPLEGKALTTVLKMNLISTIQTENYPYHFLASLFVRRDDVRKLVKATIGSQEWCGNTFKEILPRPGGTTIHHHSYFDGEGDGDDDLPLGPDGLLSEQLLLALRPASLPEGGRARLRVADPMVDNRSRPVKVREATLLAGPVETIETPDGGKACRRFDLRFVEGGAASYWIETGGRRALVRMTSPDGSKLTLREQRRRNYWSR